MSDETTLSPMTLVGRLAHGATLAALSRIAGAPSIDDIQEAVTVLTVALDGDGRYPLVDALTTVEAAALLGRTRQHVAHLCAEGVLPATRIGRDWRIDRAGVVAYRDAEKDKGGRPRRDGRRS
jgi:excisionase family DNA binding protein